MNTVGELRRRGHCYVRILSPRAIRAWRRTRQGNMNVTKNSAGVSPMGADADGSSDGPHR